MPRARLTGKPRQAAWKQLGSLDSAAGAPRVRAGFGMVVLGEDSRTLVSAKHLRTKPQCPPRTNQTQTNAPRSTLARQSVKSLTPVKSTFLRAPRGPHPPCPSPAVAAAAARGGPGRARSTNARAGLCAQVFVFGGVHDDVDEVSDFARTE